MELAYITVFNTCGAEWAPWHYICGLGIDHVAHKLSPDWSDSPKEAMLFDQAAARTLCLYWAIEYPQYKFCVKSVKEGL